MECFWDTVDTIGEGFGFSLFGARHLVTLALYIAFAALSCKRYKAPDGNPLAWFRDRFGHHWIGFPVLLTAVFALMDVPVLLKGRQENKAIRAAE